MAQCEAATNVLQQPQLCDFLYLHV